MSLLAALRPAPVVEQKSAGFLGLEPFGDNGWSGSGISETSALNLPTVWACETLIADSIASMPIDVYRKTPDGRVPLPVPGWIAYPNPYATRIEFETQRVMSLLGWGNAFTFLDRLGGNPDGTIMTRRNLAPWRVTVIARGATADYFLDGVPIDPRFLQHIRGYPLPGDVVGMSVIQQAARSLGLSKAADEFGNLFFENGANAGGVLEVPAMPADASDGVVQRLRDMFARRHSGIRNAHRPMVLTGGTQWKQLTVNPVDAQFLETRKYQTSEIARWFRVPPHMVGDVEKSTSWGTGIEQQTTGFVRFTLLPWLGRLEAADSALLHRPRYVKYNVDSFVRAELVTRYQAYTLGRNGGWLSANEIRELEDLPDIDTGDTYLQPLNMGEQGAQANGLILPSQ